MAAHPPLSDFQRVETEASAQTYAKSLHGHETLIAHLITEESNSRPNSNAKGQNVHIDQLCRHVLLTVDTRIIHYLDRGHLPRQLRVDLALTRVLVSFNATRLCDMPPNIS